MDSDCHRNMCLCSSVGAYNTHHTSQGKFGIMILHKHGHTLPKAGSINGHKNIDVDCGCDFKTRVHLR